MSKTPIFFTEIKNFHTHESVLSTFWCFWSIQGPLRALRGDKYLIWKNITVCTIKTSLSRFFDQNGSTLSYWTLTLTPSTLHHDWSTIRTQCVTQGHLRGGGVLFNKGLQIPNFSLTSIFILAWISIKDFLGGFASSGAPRIPQGHQISHS